MSRLYRIAALGLGVLLLVAPAAMACGDLGGMGAGCPMGGMPGMPGMPGMSEMPEMSHHGEMTETPGSMSTSPCDSSDGTAEDCCEVREAPERVRALTLESTRHVVVPAVTPLEIVLQPAPLGRLAKGPPIDASRRYELGLFTLLSTFLL